MLLFSYRKIKKQLDSLSLKLETSKINEYIELLNDTPRLLWKNFISGLAKGIGIAIGFTILRSYSYTYITKNSNS